MNLFLAILNKLPAPDLTGDQFRKVLLEQQGESTIWPREEDFQKAWLENPVFETMGAARIQWILRQVDGQPRFDESSDSGVRPPIFVEHIMPQDWIPTWPLPSGKQGLRWFERSDEGAAKDDTQASNLRDRLKESFGNLTLLKQPISSAVSNAPFSDKKPDLLANLVLKLDQGLSSITSWDEETIKARGSRLFEIARRIWPQ